MCVLTTKSASSLWVAKRHRTLEQIKNTDCWYKISNHRVKAESEEKAETRVFGAGRNFLAASHRAVLLSTKS